MSETSLEFRSQSLATSASAPINIAAIKHSQDINAKLDSTIEKQAIDNRIKAERKASAGQLHVRLVKPSDIAEQEEKQAEAKRKESEAQEAGLPAKEKRAGGNGLKPYSLLITTTNDVKDIIVEDKNNEHCLEAAQAYVATVADVQSWQLFSIKKQDGKEDIKLEIASFQAGQIDITKNPKSFRNKTVKEAVTIDPTIEPLPAMPVA